MTSSEKHAANEAHSAGHAHAASSTTPKSTPPASASEVAGIAASLLGGYLGLAVGAGTPSLPFSARDHAVSAWAVAMASALLAEAQKQLDAQAAATDEAPMAPPPALKLA